MCNDWLRCDFENVSTTECNIANFKTETVHSIVEISLMKLETPEHGN